jgi:Ca2+-binding EF-hand superfamily protein
MIVQDYIVREITLSVLAKAKKFEIDGEKRNKKYQQYLVEFSEKWSRADKLVYFQLQKITNFSKEEIEEIQKEYNKVIEQKYRNIPSDSATRKGIGLKEFKQIMGTLSQKKAMKAKTMLNLDDESLERIFKHFDDDGSGLLDFRLFFEKLNKESSLKFDIFIGNFFVAPAC